MLKKISNILIILGVLLFIIINIYEYKQIYNNEIIVNKLELKEEVSNYYVGYIIIKNLNIKIPLVYGTSKEELDQNVVGISKYSSSKHLILAGHAIESVFLSLYNIKLQTEIEISLNDNYYKYIVNNVYIVNENDLSVYNNTGLTLITCINKKQRLIVNAKTA